MRCFFTCLFYLLSLSCLVYGQDDDVFYKNFGMNAGYAMAKPQYPALDAFKKRFDAGPGLNPGTMQLDNLSRGFSGGFALFGFHDYMDFEYRVLTVKGSYDQFKNSNQQHNWFKLYQHSVRYSYNRGWAFGKFGLFGVYGGAAIFAGTWGVKIKDAKDEKFQSLSVDGFHSFAIGIAPQLTVRLRFLELKAFYDYSFLQHNLNPVYHKMHDDPTTPGADDGALKGRFTNLGLSATFFIAFGKPKPRPEPSKETAEERAAEQQFNRQQTDFNRRREVENEQSRKRIEETQRRQEREDRRSNEKWGR